MTLQKNLTAPVFKLNDVYGRLIDLEAYKDKKVLIGFFRHAGCPFCNLRVHTLSKAHQELKAVNFEMIFFFESTSKVILRSSFHQGVSPIPIISDPEKKWYDTYGLESSAYKSAVSHITTFVQTAFKAKMNGLPIHMMADGESINTMPAEFLLDKDLVVKKVHYSQRLNDRMDIDDIKAFVKNSNYFG
jgi:thioredoxin-dependent peroxiredoxin